MASNIVTQHPLFKPRYSRLVNSDSTYRYKALDPTRDQSRLLLFRRQPRNAIPTCLMVTYDFGHDKMPDYIALSYVWGDPSRKNTILVDGKHLQIRRNLYEFLQIFQADNIGSLTLWVDAICIDQAQNEERNHQVSMMSRIYKRSRLVVSWLGYNTMDFVVSSFQSDIPSENPQVLFNNPYFSRLWIIQEFLLAPDLAFLCDNTWISLARMLAIMSRHIPHLPSGIKALLLERLERTESLLSSPFNHSVHRLRQLFTRFHDFQCEDPRDKIYGLDGLLDPRSIIVNYNSAVAQVFLDAIFAIYCEDLHDGLQPMFFDSEYYDLGRAMGISENLLKACGRMATRVDHCSNVGQDCIMGYKEANEDQVEYWWLQRVQRGRESNMPRYEFFTANGGV